MKNKLKAVQISKAPPGKMQDGDGLMLLKGDADGKWIWRYSFLGKRRDMGLGRWPDVSLAEARQQRDKWESEIAQGRDPVDTRNQQRAEIQYERDRTDPAIQDLIQTVFEARKETLRGAGDRGRWLSPLRVHIIPKIGKTPTSKINRFLLAETIKPIWRSKHPTALKVMRRMRIVLREGQLMGYQTDPIEVDAASRILGDVKHVETPIEATPWQEIPALYQRLGNSIADDCLRLMILTAVRAHAATGARAEEFEADIWTVPAERVKGTEKSVQDFRVPLSEEAQAIIRRRMECSEDHLFTAYRSRPISTNALHNRLNDMGERGRPHGFRTSFKTWAQDMDACGWEVSETILNHTIGNKVERAYARSDLLDRRRPVMQAWADFVTGKEAKVVKLDRRA